MEGKWGSLASGGWGRETAARKEAEWAQAKGQTANVCPTPVAWVLLDPVQQAWPGTHSSVHQLSVGTFTE